MSLASAANGQCCKLCNQVSEKFLTASASFIDNDSIKQVNPKQWHMSDGSFTVLVSVKLFPHHHLLLFQLLLRHFLLLLLSWLCNGLFFLGKDHLDVAWTAHVRCSTQHSTTALTFSITSTCTTYWHYHHQHHLLALPPPAIRGKLESWQRKIGQRNFGNHFLVGSVKSATVNWAMEKWSRFLIQRWLNAIVSYLRYCRNWKNGDWKFNNVA